MLMVLAVNRACGHPHQVSPNKASEHCRTSKREREREREKESDGRENNVTEIGRAREREGESETCRMHAALHVYLDVLYNHTSICGHIGPNQHGP